MPTYSNTADLRLRLANCMRILAAEEMLELTYGHLSLRLSSDEPQYLILGNFHDRWKHPMDASIDDFVVMNGDGDTSSEDVDGPGERFIHTEIYRSRSDVGSVLHCHPSFSTAFSIAGVEILPVDHLGLIFSPSVPLHDYSGQIDTPELGRAVADTLGGGTAVSLRSHGIAVVGSSPETATLSGLALEHTARLQMLAGQVGEPRPFPPEHASDDGRFSRGLGPKEYFETAWTHYARKHRELLYDIDPERLHLLP